MSLVAVLALMACARSDEAYIQGTWIYSAPSVGGIAPQSSVHTLWTFDDGRVVASSCCEFRPGFEGRYRVIQSEEDALTLHIYDMQGPGAAEPFDLHIIIDRDRQTLTVEGVGPFIQEE